MKKSIYRKGIAWDLHVNETVTIKFCALGKSSKFTIYKSDIPPLIELLQQFAEVDVDEAP